MTTTEVAADPFAHVTVGSNITDNRGWENRDNGIWTNRNQVMYTWCDAEAPDGAGRCSRPTGHPLEWNHIAANADTPHANYGIITAVWPALIPDPRDAMAPTLSSHTSVGHRVTRHEDYNNDVHGIWTRDRYTWCGAQDPTSQRVCSRPIGHPANWQHVAASDHGGGLAYVDAIWTDTTHRPGAIAAATLAALPPDPLAHIVRGTPTDRERDDDDRRFWNGDTGSWCGQPDPNNQGLICSRPPGHALHWQHIAANAANVVAVWNEVMPTFDDPHANVERGNWVGDQRGWNDETTGIRVVPANRCGFNPGDKRNVCTRAKDHYGKHVGTDNDQVQWVHPNDKVWVPELVVVPFDDNDGSPIDADDTILKESPPIGMVVRLRDRENRLYVTGVRATGEVEVIDLKRSELRMLPLGRLVNIDANVTTEAELTLVGRWYAGHRDEVRKVAVREYRNGRWCMAGLNENLATLGLPQYEPTLTGLITLSVPFSHPDVSVGQSTVEKLVRDALKDPAVVATLTAALPEIKDIELDPTSLSIRATDFARK